MSAKKIKHILKHPLFATSSRGTTVKSLTSTGKSAAGMASYNVSDIFSSSPTKPQKLTKRSNKSESQMEPDKNLERGRVKNWFFEVLVHYKFSPKSQNSFQSVVFIKNNYLLCLNFVIKQIAKRKKD